MTQEITIPVDLSKYIERKRYGERPHIRGRKVLVTTLAVNAIYNNMSVNQLAEDYTLTEEEVAAALLYYYEHKDELDKQDEEENEIWEQMYERYGEKDKSE